MKNIKCIGLTCILLTTVSGYAQTKKTLEEKSIERTNKLHKEVKLTKAQYSKIKAINLEYLKEKEALETKMKAIKKVRKEQIDQTLTDDQKKKQETLKKKKKK